MITIWNEELQGVDFPYVWSEQFLEESLAHELANQFPGEEYFEKLALSQGGRNDLGRWTPGLYRFLETSPAWKRLYDYFVSSDFVCSALSYFRKNLQDNGICIEPDKSSYSRHIFGYESKISKFWENLLHSSGVSLLFEKLLGDQYSVSFSIGKSKDGYGTPIHHDARHKVIVLLMYFNDINEFRGKGEGGELVLYRLKRERPYYLELKTPIPEDLVEVEAVITPKVNTGVMFLNTPFAYHRANPLRGTKGARKFLYVSIARRWRRDAWC